MGSEDEIGRLAAVDDRRARRQRDRLARHALHHRRRPVSAVIRKARSDGMEIKSAISTPGRSGGAQKKDKTPFSCEHGCGQNSWGKPSLATICEHCLVAKLKAAGIDAAILDGVRMKSTESADVEVAAAD
jgi:hypothetical protein